MTAAGRIITIAVISAVCTTAAGASAQKRPVAGADSPSASFMRGNQLYESGDYAGAIEAYLQVLDDGVVDAALYYNLGNAYYKANELGNAVLFFERSLRMSPRDRDVQENLALVRTRLKDKQFVTKQSAVVRGVIWLHNNLRTGEMVWFASLSYLLLCTLGVVFVFRDSSLVSALHRKVSIVSPARLLGLTLTQETLVAIALASVLVATTTVSSLLKLQMELNPRDAVVVVREIPVFGSPTQDATLQFRIHEGTLVSAGEVRRGWVRIELPGGLSGWVSSSSIRKV